MSIYDFDIKLNAVDLATYGVGIVAFPKNWESPSMSFDEVAMPLRRGTRRTSNRRNIDPLDYAIQFEISAATETDFEAYCDALRYLFSFDPLQIIGGNQPDRQRTGALKGALEIGPKMATADGVTTASCSATIHCEDPVWYSTVLSTPSGAAASDVSCPLGTQLVWPITTVTFSGSAASTTLTYKHYDGTPLGSLELTHAFVNTDVVSVDHNLMAVTLNGARKDSLITNGDFFALDPRDGSYPLSHWPKVRSSAGALALSYARAW
jgi:hypothetical protein